MRASVLSRTQIHGPIGPHSWEAQGRELAQCYKLGLTRNVGVSNFSEKELFVSASHELSPS